MSEGPTINHLCFTLEQFKTLSKEVKHPGRAVYYNHERGTLWTSTANKKFRFLTFVRRYECWPKILSSFCKEGEGIHDLLERMRYKGK